MHYSKLKVLHLNVFVYVWTYIFSYTGRWHTTIKFHPVKRLWHTLEIAFMIGFKFFNARIRIEHVIKISLKTRVLFKVHCVLPICYYFHGHSFKTFSDLLGIEWLAFRNVSLPDQVLFTDYVLGSGQFCWKYLVLFSM